MTSFTLIRSSRKTITLQVLPTLEVVVRAPQRMPRRDIDAFVARHQAWIDKHLARQASREALRRPPDEAEIAALRARAKAEIPPLVEHYANMMGLTPTGVKITSAKTRFGSCSGKNSLCFSYYLMRYPQAAIEYVVVHELAHIVHKNHSKDFYALIARYMPDHQDRRKLLKG